MQGVCGTTFALDHYAPTQTALVALTGVVTGVSPLAICKAPSLFYTSTKQPMVHGCVGTIYLPLTGMGPSPATSPSKSATLPPSQRVRHRPWSMAELRPAPVISFGMPGVQGGWRWAQQVLSATRARLAWLNGWSPAQGIQGIRSDTGATGASGSGAIPSYTFPKLPRHSRPP